MIQLKTPVFAEKKPAEPIFKKNQILLSGIKIAVEIADTDDRRAHGLMFREKLGPNEGMLFIFENEQPLSFWMKNTLIDLAIGFFDKDRTLVDVKEMKAVTSIMATNLPSYQSRVPAKYALEMNKGWFEKNKIKIGARFAFAKKAVKNGSPNSGKESSQEKSRSKSLTDSNTK